MIPENARRTAGPTPVPAFRTARLHCRPLAAGDRGLYLALYTDPGVMAWVGAPLATDAATRSFAAACRANRARPPLDRYWVIEAIGGGELGLLALRRCGAPPGAAEIGAMLLPAQQSRGHAAEAIAALVALAFGDAAIERLFTRHHCAHAAARALMRKLGFHCDAGPARCQQRWTLAREAWRPGAAPA